MLFRFISTFVLTVVCSVAFSQQTQSPGLELNLEKFPEQSTNEQRTTEKPAIEKNNELQLDLNQFDQQQDSKELELNLEQFNDKTQTDRSQPTNSQAGSTQDEAASTTPKLNLEQFEKNDDVPGALEQSLDVSPPASVDNPAGKINTSGSAARKIGESDTAELDDNMELLKAGFWLLVVALVIFLLIRARIRKRRRARPPGTKQYHKPYDESNHR